MDEQGVLWKVKLGQEPQSETAATRLLWAAGYFVDEDYYMAEFRVMGCRSCTVAGSLCPRTARSTERAWNAS